MKKGEIPMKRRWTALLLTLAMALTLGAGAVSAEGGEADGESAAEEGDVAAEIVAIPDGGQTADTQSDEPAARDETAAQDETAAEDAQIASEAAEPSPDPEGTLSYANLADRMRANYYPLRALEESVLTITEIDYGTMEEQLWNKLNDIASAQWMMSANPMLMDQAQYAQLQQAYSAMRVQYDAIREGELQKDNADALRQLRNAQNQMLVFGETLFVAIKGMEAQDAALTRQITQLDRTIQEMELRCQLGQVSQLTVEQVKAGRTQAVSGKKTLEMNLNNYLLQLESMTGAELGAPLKLGALPKVTPEQLAAMDLEADLAAAKAESYELYDAEKTYKDARKTFYESGGAGNGKSYAEKSRIHTFNTAQYTYDDKLLTFELYFRTLYAQVKDCAQTLDVKRAALAQQEKSYSVSALKFEQGNISANALADAKDELAAAKDEVASAERELFSKYTSYQWAVAYGILNG